MTKFKLGDRVRGRAERIGKTKTPKGTIVDLEGGFGPFFSETMYQVKYDNDEGAHWNHEQLLVKIEKETTIQKEKTMEEIITNIKKRINFLENQNKFLCEILLKVIKSTELLQEENDIMEKQIEVMSSFLFYIPTIELVQTYDGE